MRNFTVAKFLYRAMVDLYFLVFIHIESRRIWVSACTAHPTGEWTAQQARNFDMFLQEEHLSYTIVQRDRDSKYVEAFDDVFTGNGRAVKLTPVRSPNLQAFVERVIQTLKHEVLNGFCVVSERHLDHILRIGTDWYNHRRGHTGRNHLSPVRDDEPPPTVAEQAEAGLPHRTGRAFEVVPGRGVTSSTGRRAVEAVIPAAPMACSTSI